MVLKMILGLGGIQDETVYIPLPLQLANPTVERSGGGRSMALSRAIAVPTCLAVLCLGRHCGPT